jgi:hypothetical protein
MIENPYILDEGLRKAINAHGFEQAEVYVTRGANPNALYTVGLAAIGTSLLEGYASHGTAKQVAFLLKHGADPFHYNTVGHSALFLCINNESTEEALNIIPLLVKKVGVNYESLHETKKTALHQAADKNREPFIEKLLQLGADPNCEEDGRKTPLDYALSPYDYVRSKPDYFPAVKMLYQHGANARTRVLQDCLTPEQLVELEEARRARKKLYDHELGKYLPLPMPLVEMCSDYKGSFYS